MIPGLNTDAKKQIVEHFNYPEQSATVDVNNWKFTYSSNDLKIVQFTNTPQFTTEEDEILRSYAKEKRPKNTQDWDQVAKSLNKTAIACRFRYFGPLQGR